MENPLQFLRDLKSVAFATTDGNKPVVRIADVMIYENEVLYFLTARGKPFYKQLKENPALALVGMDKSYRTVRLTGEIEFVGREWVDRIFELNPMMNDIYPGEKRQILEAYCMKQGNGEVFDLSVVPPTRERFAFGGADVQPAGYLITDVCNGCDLCREACTTGAISEGEPYLIDAEICLECGACAEACPEEAIYISQPA